MKRPKTLFSQRLLQQKPLFPAQVCRRSPGREHHPPCGPVAAGFCSQPTAAAGPRLCREAAACSACPHREIRLQSTLVSFQRLVEALDLQQFEHGWRGSCCRSSAAAGFRSTALTGSLRLVSYHGRLLCNR